MLGLGQQQNRRFSSLSLSTAGLVLLLHSLFTLWIGGESEDGECSSGRWHCVGE